MSGKFGEKQRKSMENVKNEFHLEAVEDGTYTLYRVFSFKFSHFSDARQPGQPVQSTYLFDNPTHEQPLQFILSAEGGDMCGVTMEIDNYKELMLPIDLEEGQKLKYTGGSTAVLYNREWHAMKLITLDEELLIVGEDQHSLNFSCDFASNEEVQAKLEVRLIGPAEKVK